MTGRAVEVPTPRRSSNGHGPTMRTGPVAVVEATAGLTRPVDPPAPVPEAVAARRTGADPTIVHGLVTASLAIGLGALLAALMLAGVIRAAESVAVPWVLGILVLANAGGWGAGWVLRRQG